jgi:hypothetical protein
VDYELDEHELACIEFRLGLTPTQRWEVNWALVQEYGRKRALARQMAGKPTRSELKKPIHPEEEWPFDDQGSYCVPKR